MMNSIHLPNVTEAPPLFANCAGNGPQREAVLEKAFD